MNQKSPLNVAVGFATGRKAFQRVLRTYIENWQEAGLVGDAATVCISSSPTTFPTRIQGPETTYLCTLAWRSASRAARWSTAAPGTKPSIAWSAVGWSLPNRRPFSSARDMPLCVTPSFTAAWLGAWTAYSFWMMTSIQWPSPSPAKAWPGRASTSLPRTSGISRMRTSPMVITVATSRPSRTSNSPGRLIR